MKKGLLSDPMLNLGIGLLSTRGTSDGLMKGLLSAQNAAYQKQLMQQMRAKQSRQEEADAARQRLASQSVMQAVPGSGPLNANPQAAYNVDPSQQQMMQDMATGAPDLFNQVMQNQMIPGGGDPTTLQRNLQAAFDPNTPEDVRSAMMQILMKPQTQIQMPGGQMRSGALTNEEKTGLGLDPAQVYFWNSKTGKPEQVTQSRMTEGESKQIAQQEVSLQDMGQLENLLFGNNPVDLAGFGGMFTELRTQRGWTNSAIDFAADKLGYPLDSREAKAMSLIAGLSNTLLAAMRGAQVGPEEQVKFEQQLLMPGQPIEVQRSNLSRLQENLGYLSRRQSALRRLGVAKEAPPEVANAALDASGFDRSSTGGP